VASGSASIARASIADSKCTFRYAKCRFCSPRQPVGRQPGVDPVIQPTLPRCALPWSPTCLQHRVFVRSAMKYIDAISRIRFLRHATVLWLLFAFSASTASAYSVLTHEAIIDSTWDSAIKPLAAQTIPGCHSGGVDGGARIRLRGLHYSGFGILSVRQQVFQRFDALRPERRLHSEPDPRFAGPQ
jgi:hypothetical protein